jgi:hypothetical protein
MEAAGIDQQEFRARQRSAWDEASKGWRDWSEFIDRSTAPVSERLMAMARVEAGQRVLDVAAGYGEPSLTAAKIVGPEGGVVATEIRRACWRTVANARPRPGFRTSSSSSRTLPHWTSRRPASTRPCRVGGSSSSPTARARHAASEAS